MLMVLIAKKLTLVADICSMSGHVRVSSASVTSSVVVGPRVVNCSKSKRKLHMAKK